jgi:hypothetical protein
MGTGSVLQNEYFMVCFYAERHKESKFQVTFLFAFIFELSNRLAGFNENCFEYFTVGKHPNLMRAVIFLVITQKVAIIRYRRVGTTYRCRFMCQESKRISILDSYTWDRWFIPKRR